MRPATNLTAVILTVMIVASTVVPAVAMPPSPSAGNAAAPGATPPQSSAAVALEDGRSSLEYRSSASTLLADAELPNGRTSRLETALGDSIDAYLDPNRTTAGPFKLDRRIIARTHTHAPEIARELLRSDAVLARVAVADAERAIEWAHRNNESVSTDRRNDLQAAKTHLDRGDRLRTGEAAPPAPVEQYHKAWSLANEVIADIDRRVTPRVELRYRVDPPHNETLSYPVAGNVSDPRVSEITEVSIEHEGGTKTVPLNHTNSTFATFNTSIDLQRERNTIRVVATDPEIRYATRTGSGASESPENAHRGGGPDNGNGPKAARGKPNTKAGAQSGRGQGRPGATGRTETAHPDDSGEADDLDSRTGVAILRLDGDGLPDRFELTTIGTDPLSKNSAANATDADESLNDRVDGAEDFDGDGLIAFSEYRRGGDPLDPDTDGDGLTDGFENRFAERLDLGTTDTDSDGVPDPEEDFDDDGLTAAREDALNGSIFTNDTDADGLADALEASIGTRLDVQDTDGDGLTDAEERRSGIDTDPTVPDTDGDGTLDGNETYQTRVTDAETGASALLTGVGNVAGETGISRNGQPLFANYSPPGVARSPYIAFETEREFDSATITVPYEENVSNESALGLFRYNESLGTYEPVPSTVDSAAGTVSATVDHFSTYVVFDRRSWQEYLESRGAILPVGEGGTETLPSTTGDFVDIQSVDPRSYPNVTVFASVNTTAGENGALTASDFSVYDQQDSRTIQTVEFSNESAVDVVFVFDDTGSMGNEINTLQSKTLDLTDDINESGLDARYALVSFKDGTEVDQRFTADAREFKEAVDGLYASGGGDLPEDGLDATYQGGQLEFRENAQPVVVHITDAAAHSSGRTAHGVDEVEQLLRERGATFFSVSPAGGYNRDPHAAKELSDRLGGVWMEIGDSDFSVFLEEIERRITERYAITYRACNPTKGEGRRVDLYVDDGAAGVANDTGGYIAPTGACDDPSVNASDPDGDGIPTYLERDGLPLAGGSKVFTDPFTADTDGDGLADGEEVLIDEKVKTESGRFAGFGWSSDPTAKNTDGSGGDDAEERSSGSSAKRTEILLTGFFVQTAVDSDGEPLEVEGGGRGAGTSANIGDRILLGKTGRCSNFDLLGVCTEADVAMFLRTNEAGAELLEENGASGSLIFTPEKGQKTFRTDTVERISEPGVRRMSYKVKTREKNPLSLFDINLVTLKPGAVSGFGNFEYRADVEGTPFQDASESASEDVDYASPRNELQVRTRILIDTTAKNYKDLIESSCSATNCAVSGYEEEVGRSVRLIGAVSAGGDPFVNEVAIDGIAAFGDKTEEVPQRGFENQRPVGIVIYREA